MEKDNKIFAPFTEEQVEMLNKFQQNGHYHPFTCGSPDEIPECTRKSGSQGILIATVDGWVCPCGKYHQDWAHSFMVDPFIVNRTEF